MPAEKPRILMYAHRACPSVYPLQAMFEQAKVNYEYLDIHQDEDARQRVRDINNGDESVPTLVFPDGSTLTEPSPAAIQAKLRQFGYQTGGQAWLILNSPRFVLALLAMLVLLKLLHVL